MKHDHDDLHAMITSMLIDCFLKRTHGTEQYPSGSPLHGVDFRYLHRPSIKTSSYLHPFLGNHSKFLQMLYPMKNG